MLFPTIRFAIFFAMVLPASWLLTPHPLGRGERERRAQPWALPVLLVALGALAGPLAPTGWPGAARGVGWLVAIGAVVLGAVRWWDLQGLARWNVFILVASYLFYGNYAWPFVALLAGSTIFNQIAATTIYRSEDDRRRRILVTGAVAVNLGLLGWFKYKGFFLDSASSLLHPLGIAIDPPARSLLPPVGISFFTFCAISYVIDVYRHKVRPSPLLDFAVYLSFFPHLVAGPIVRASEFLPQLRRTRDARQIDAGLAFWLITIGLFKKVVVSSYLASAIVDPVFRIPEQHQAIDTLLGVYGYAIQIYCDFSGYTDMAIGLALLLGFRFPQNFDAPYTAASLQDFWRRWHMTLSRWLRDYVYIPLGGNQQGARRASVNMFLTMLIGGLWHGAAWTFVFWGALHGGYLAWERHRSRTAELRRAATQAVAGEATDPDDDDLAGIEPTSKAGPLAALHAFTDRLTPTQRLWAGRVTTFHVVCLGWVFFRAPSLGQAFEVLGRFRHMGTGTGVNLIVVATIVAFLASQFVPTGTVGRVQAAFSRMAAWQQAASLAACLLVTNALSPTGVAPFIYFAF